MRQILCGLATGTLALSAIPAAAQQQGTFQISAAAQGLTGDPTRIGDQKTLEPDFGVSWVQPGSRFGLFQLEVRGTRRGDLLHLGKTSVAARDVKYRGITWSFEGGDSYLAPGIGDYKFSNLATPSVTFTGAAVTGRTARSRIGLIAGRTTAWRNIFGTDPDTLAQSLAIARGAYRASDRLEFTARAARVRTRNLREFNYSISATDEAGGGVRYALVPSLHLVADATAVSYRRAGSAERHRDGSLLLGASWLLARGWVQVNASRFSPGEFSVLNYPLQDREAIFGAGEYDVLPLLRLFGGVDAFRTNLELIASASSSRPQPQSDGVREFAGVRVQVGSRSAITVRGESGDRIVRPPRSGLETESDTGSFSAEYQAVVGRLTSFARFSRRENVDRTNGTASYTQQDRSVQLFVNVSRSTQLFGITTITTTQAPSSGNTYWQAGGGAQIQVPRRNLWMRTEGTWSRNVDLLTQSFVPRESLSLGLNGQLTGHFAIALNVNVDRSPMLFAGTSPWFTRSILRITQSIPTGAARMMDTGAVTAGRGRGTGSVIGLVFADWNANGILDAGEGPLPNIPVRIAAVTTVTTARDGQFTFLNVPAGLQQVGLDMSSLPVDYDPPAHPDLQVELSRGDTRRLSFGLIPLGSIVGRVLRDANANGAPDASDEPVEAAVLVLDDGARSEQVRKGRFRFDAVRSGDHTVRLLVESMAEGAVVRGPAEVPVSLTRERLTAEVAFLVSIEKRPEIRKVFPPKVGAVSPSSPDSGLRARDVQNRARPEIPTLESRIPSSDSRSPNPEPRASFSYTIQVAALSDAAKARALVNDLKAAGYGAYLAPSDPQGLFRVRVGRYTSRTTAQKVVEALEKRQREKLWLVRAQ